jgi:hypothetical protein
VERWGWESWDIVPTLQISPHVLISGCLHMWNRIFGVNYLNRKTISTLLSLPLYIVWAGMNTELQLIVTTYVGKGCGHCWWLHVVEDISFV